MEAWLYWMCALISLVLLVILTAKRRWFLRASVWTLNLTLMFAVIYCVVLLCIILLVPY